MRTISNGSPYLHDTELFSRPYVAMSLQRLRSSQRAECPRVNPRPRCLTVGALVIVPVQLVVVCLDKPLASGEALSLHPHTSHRHLCTSQLPRTLGCGTSMDSSVPEPP